MKRLGLVLCALALIASSCGVGVRQPASRRQRDDGRHAQRLASRPTGGAGSYEFRPDTAPDGIRRAERPRSDDRVRAYRGARRSANRSTTSARHGLLATTCARGRGEPWRQALQPGPQSVRDLRACTSRRSSRRPTASARPRRLRSRAAVLHELRAEQRATGSTSSSSSRAARPGRAPAHDGRQRWNAADVGSVGHRAVQARGRVWENPDGDSVLDPGEETVIDEVYAADEPSADAQPGGAVQLVGGPGSARQHASRNAMTEAAEIARFY